MDDYHSFNVDIMIDGLSTNKLRVRCERVYNMEAL